MRLIDADELYVDARLGENEEPYISLRQINDASTVDAEPVRHGHWMDRGYMKVGYHCSLCGGYVVAGKEKYCPHCGAKMDLPYFNYPRWNGKSMMEVKKFFEEVEEDD